MQPGPHQLQGCTRLTLRWLNGLHGWHTHLADQRGLRVCPIVCGAGQVFGRGCNQPTPCCRCSKAWARKEAHLSPIKEVIHQVIQRPLEAKHWQKAPREIAHAANRPPHKRYAQLPQVAGLTKAHHRQLVGNIKTNLLMQFTGQIKRLLMPAAVVPVIRRRPKLAQVAIALLGNKIDMHPVCQRRVVCKIFLDIGAEFFFLHYHPQTVMFGQFGHKAPAHTRLRTFVRAAGIGGDQYIQGSSHFSSSIVRWPGGNTRQDVHPVAAATAPGKQERHCVAAVRPATAAQ